MKFLSLLLVWVVSAIAAERPNIVLIMADDLGYGDLGCYGSRINETPSMSSLRVDCASRIFIHPEPCARRRVPPP